MREASLASEPGQLESMPTDCDRPPACLPFPKPDYLRYSTDAAALRSIENWETKQGGFLALPSSLPLSAKSPLLLSLQLQLVVEFGSPSVRASVGSPPVGSPFAWRQRRTATAAFSEASSTSPTSSSSLLG